MEVGLRPIGPAMYDAEMQLAREPKKQIKVIVSRRQWEKLRWEAARRRRAVAHLVFDRVHPWIESLPDPPGAGPARISRD